MTCALALGDVDGDGDLDLAAGEVAAGYPAGPAPNRLYLNDGTAGFTEVTATGLPPVADETYALVFADVDGDGDVDLLVGNNGPDRLLLNDGTGTFADVTGTRLPRRTTATRGVAFGDVDGDGDPDLVLGNSIGGPLLYTNLHRQLSTPLLPTSGRGYDVELTAALGYATSSHTGIVALGLVLLPAPLALPPIGTLDIAPAVVLAPPVSIAAAAGSAAYRLPIPASAELLGVVLHTQALVLDDVTTPTCT